MANNEEPNQSRKRKGKEVEETPFPSTPLTANLFPLLQQRVSPRPSTALCLDLNRRLPNSHEGTSIMSIPGPFPFKSYTSLLNEGDYQDFLPPCIREQNEHIDQMIKLQAEHLSRTLTDMQRSTFEMLLSAAEERATKKLKMTQLQLNTATTRIAALQYKEGRLKAELQNTKSRMKQLESTVATLRAQLQEATIRGGKPEGEGCSSGQRPEDSHSSRVDTERMEPIMLACRACGKRVATVMLLPCRHICICSRCDKYSIACPVCHDIKTQSIQVSLPQGL